METSISKQQSESGHVELSIRGRLTAANATEIKKRLREMLLESVGDVFIDLSGVDFIDSSGLAVLVAVLKLTRERGGTLKLFGLQDGPREVFHLTRLDRIFDLHADRDSAGTGIAPS